MSASRILTRSPRRQPPPRAPVDAWAPVAPPVWGWIALMITAVTLVVCYLVGRWLQAGDTRLFTLLPPLTGRLDPRLPWTTIAPLGVGGAVLTWGPSAARRLGWRGLLWLGALVALAWSASLAVVDGSAGFVDPVLREGDYLSSLPFIEAPGPFLSRFVGTIDLYSTHVRAHPPGLLIALWWLDGIGLGGPAWVAVLQHVAAASAVPAALLAVRDVSTSAVARRVAPFLVLAPAAVAIGSGDAVFLAVGVWAVAALVVATGRSSGSGAEVTWALVGGLLFGLAIFLSYGLVLLGAVPLAVAIARRRLRPLLVAGVGVALVTIAVRACRLLVVGRADGDPP